MNLFELYEKEKKNNLHLYIVIGSGTGNRFFIYLNLPDSLPILSNLSSRDYIP